MKTIYSTISKLIPIFLLIVFSLLCHTTSATVITVPGDYSTIQTAINAATDSDEIIVSPGTYNEHINWGGKNIVLRSTDPTSPIVVASTIINGNHAGQVVTSCELESESRVVFGFPITNAYVRLGSDICS